MTTALEVTGFCECGCGKATGIAKTTNLRFGHVRGRPFRFIYGHASRKQRATFDTKYVVDSESGCWIWTGRIDHVGRPRFGHGNGLAHRVAWQRAHGSLDPEAAIEHACSNILCVNPAHLELRRPPPPAPNPSGICQCGCGQPAPIAKQTDRRLGYANGEPMRFIAGHVGFLRKRVNLDSLWDAEDRGHETPCWIMRTKPMENGYARIGFNRRTVSAHRLSYELHVGPIPDGYDIDHLCAVRNCVNPAHLEAVTRSVNVRRAVARRRGTA